MAQRSEGQAEAHTEIWMSALDGLDVWRCWTRADRALKSREWEQESTHVSFLFCIHREHQLVMLGLLIAITCLGIFYTNQPLVTLPPSFW